MDYLGAGRVSVGEWLVGEQQKRAFGSARAELRIRMGAQATGRARETLRPRGLFVFPGRSNQDFLQKQREIFDFRPLFRCSQ